MKEEFVKAYKKALILAEERYAEVYKYYDHVKIHDIDEFGMTFQFEEYFRGHYVNSEYITIGWEELS